MDYQSTIDYLFQRLPSFQRIGKAAYKSDIGNITKACEILENPHRKFKSIHVAGTNGKGSTSNMIASILQHAGYKVGLYTSPHIKDLRERIKINDNMISKKEIINFVSKNKEKFEMLDLSFFEFIVALAFNYFAKEKVDIAVIETGLGGRLDSTNIIIPELSVITNVSLDHTNLLGDNLESIAKEKSGIIKEKIPVIIGRKQDDVKKIFFEIAHQKKSPIKFAYRHTYEKIIDTEYQKENINTAVSSIFELINNGWNVKNKHITEGLLYVKTNQRLLARWNIIGKKPMIICDMAHNEEGIKTVLKEIRKLKYNNLHFVLGMTNDKNIDKILQLLPKKCIYYFCKAKVPRGLATEILFNKANQIDLIGHKYISVKQALNSAKEKAKQEDLIFIGGSTFVVSEIL